MISYTDFLDKIKVEKRGDSLYIFCFIRKKWLVSTPEEVVRQAAVLYLISLGYSPAHITVERLVKVHSLKRRYDIVVSNKQGEHEILVECKAPSVPISQDTLDQAGNYNITLKGAHIWITNGHTNFAFQIDHQKKACTAIDSLPLPK